MKIIGIFASKRWGRVTVQRGCYDRADGPTAIRLLLDSGAPLATLSVNMYGPGCSMHSADLPDDCIFVKQWEENEVIAAEALASRMFVPRPDLGVCSSGFVTAPVWQLAPTGNAS